MLNSHEIQIIGALTQFLLFNDKTNTKDGEVVKTIKTLRSNCSQTALLRPLRLYRRQANSQRLKSIARSLNKIWARNARLFTPVMATKTGIA